VSDRLYVPHFNVLPADDVRGFVREIGTAQLVTVAADGTPDATFLPVLWRDGELVGHFARANTHWRRIADGTAGLAVVTGPDAYVSPSFYATKVEHGRVVPTWNYAVVHAHGPLRVIDDRVWLREFVETLTQRYESPRIAPWKVSDAPADFIDTLVGSIVGIEIPVLRLTGKWKVSQNRPEKDRLGVAQGLLEQESGSNHTMAQLVRQKNKGG